MNTKFFDCLITDKGIWQHTDGTKPHLDKGFALDDAARGLICCLILGKYVQAGKLFDYIKSARHKGGFYLYRTADGRFFDWPASEDSTSQCLWAMSWCAKNGFRPEEAGEIIAQISPRIRQSKSIRGEAYALLGASLFDVPWAEELAEKIVGRCQNLMDSWYWPEATATYANGIIPYSLLRYGLQTGSEAYTEVATKLLTFIDGLCRNNRHLGPIGNDGWAKQNKPVPNFSQQPIDAAYMYWAWTAFGQLTGDAGAKQKANAWYEWFNGSNTLNSPMYDPADNKCFDGIDPSGINHDSGAESNICWLLTLWVKSSGQTF